MVYYVIIYMLYLTSFLLFCYDIYNRFCLLLVILIIFVHNVMICSVIMLSKFYVALFYAVPFLSRNILRYTYN